LEHNHQNTKCQPSNCWNTTTKIHSANFQTVGTQSPEYRVPTLSLTTCGPQIAHNSALCYLHKVEQRQFNNHAINVSFPKHHSVIQPPHPMQSTKVKVKRSLYMSLWRYPPLILTLGTKWGE